VVKVAPPGVPPVLNRDVLRQARVLRALRRTAAVPVPEVLHQDAGAPPEVPPLFVMSFILGASYEPLFDLGEPPAGTEIGVMAERLRDAARTLAALHGVEPVSVGLADEPVIGPAGEIERWSRPLRTVDPALAPGWEEVRDALRSTVPAPQPAVIVHGDFRLGNLLAVADRITGVVDWEIWSIGDPRVDAGWFLLNADPATYRRATPYAGLLPAPGELAEVYAAALGRTVPDLTWFEALARFKSVATWSLIVKHNRRRAAPDPDLEAMAPLLPDLLGRARSLLG
jgi:aminoglycoside phosphotransferase (APT) family kinase protein